MTLAEDNGPERGGDDLLAAEYVLGVLAADERQIASRRIDTEAGFARLVDAWEAHFAPMADAYAAVEAPASAKAAIDRRLFASSVTTPAAPSIGLLGSLAFWRGLALAALAVFVALPLVNPPLPQPETSLVASLAADNSNVKYLAVYDAARHEVGLSLVSGERGAGKDFELWLIEGKNAPVSMGVIPAGQSARMAVTPAVQEKLAQGAVLAVSLEPAGGSPTGQPTGPVVAAGDLKGI
ncbi:anti-sigma factor [Mesorhizobium sp. WSM3862]|uniref:anti-sigma factor n=1 Tax=Mesorhizobium sp. WSM3862 TaxID=632858 RepID=UPI000BB0A993|nr:anti-sigma factor [Mesorhizobium sp. WSM3862]PBB97661.1 anti-sigma factor [Mesorhizobium sp. WSM3862]